MKLHRLDSDRVRQIRERLLGINASRHEALLEPSGRTPARYRGLLETSLELAGGSIALELGDDAVRADLAAAVEAAQNWLRLEPTPASPGLQSTLVDAVVDPAGGTTFTTTKLPPIQPPAGAREGWHIGVFSLVLDTLVAFGPPEAAREAAGAREEWYRSNEVIAEEAYFAAVRGEKCWLLGDDAGARAGWAEAVKTSKQPLSRAASSAFLALMVGTPAIFHEALGDIVRDHNRTFAREPEQATGVFTLEGLALCRVARTYGIEVEESPYLPVRFLAPGALRPANT